MTMSEHRKLFYKIGEVCQITGIEPYVLRYWESEFPALAPTKNKAGQRIYRNKDIEMVTLIKKLLYEEGYTIAGANKRIQATHHRKPTPKEETLGPAKRETSAERPAPSGPSREAFVNESSSILSAVKQELESLLTLLDKPV